MSKTINDIVKKLELYWEQIQQEIKGLDTERIYELFGTEVGSMITAGSPKKAKKRLKNKNPEQIQILRSYDFSRIIRK